MNNVVNNNNVRRSETNCFSLEPTNSITDRMNEALNSSGEGYVLSLCPNTLYPITAPLIFSSRNQEISTQNYPTDDSRAILLVNGSTAGSNPHTTAVDGTCPDCDNVILRNIQINGNRGNGPILNGGANAEMGGDNVNQTIEYLHSFDPRGWSCLHIAEGTLKCSNTTIQNNDIGPCGNDGSGQWSDGISHSCMNGLIRNNMVENPTDGGIVIFGSPGTLVENNTIWVVNQTLLGGINLVDYNPWNGNFSGVIVQNNTVLGGFASGSINSNGLGVNDYDVIVKIGIAIGPQTWFGDKYGNNASSSAIIRNNGFAGAFGYGMVVSSASNFTITGNILEGAATFVGARGPNCTKNETIPNPAAFIIDRSDVTDSVIQSNFQNVSDAESLICIIPPNGGAYWPYGKDPGSSSGSSTSNPGVTSSKSTVDRTVGLTVGIIAGVIFVGLLTWFMRRWAAARRAKRVGLGTRPAYSIL